MALAPDNASVVRQYLYTNRHVPTVNIAVLGCERVGKRSLLQRFCYGGLVEQSRSGTTELEWHKLVAVQGKDIHIKFDLMNDGPAQMAPGNLLQYIENNETFMLVYDVTSKESFEVVQKICKLYTQLPHRRPWHTVPFFIVATKIDRWKGGWAVPNAAGYDLATSMGATYLPMSALSGEGTGDAVMVDLVSRVLSSRCRSDTLRRSMQTPRKSQSRPPPKSALKAPTMRTSMRQRTGILRLLHRSGRLLDWLRPKEGIHHWGFPTRQPPRSDPHHIPAKTVPSGHSRGRSMTSFVPAVEKEEIPALPQTKFQDAARTNPYPRLSHSMSLKRALGPDFFQEARGPMPVK